MAEIIINPTTQEFMDFLAQYNDLKGMPVLEGTAVVKRKLQKAYYALEVNEMMDDVQEGKFIVRKAVVDPSYEARHFQEVKEAKLQENVDKCVEKRYNQIFTVTLQGKACTFTTEAQTQSDLQAAGLVTSTGATYNNWVCENGVVINLTMEDVKTAFEAFFAKVSPLYTVQLNYNNEIEACTTVEQLEAIDINYDRAVEELEETEEEE